MTQFTIRGMVRRSALITVVLALRLGPAMAEGSAGDAGSSDAMVAVCTGCHSRDRGTASAEGEEPAQSLYIDATAFHASVHSRFACTECHYDLVGRDFPEHARADRRWVERFSAQFTGPARRVTKICSCCHQGEAEAYGTSIHAEARRQGITEAPTCVDCHSSHAILPGDDIESSISTSHVPATCARCHADSVRMARVNVRSEVVATYGESFHGKKNELGSGQAAVCSSCHGNHDIRRPKDPESRLSPQNIVSTCAECHPEANEIFTRSFSHKTTTAEQNPIVYYLAMFYRLAIVGTIGGMGAYILLDLWRRTLNKQRGFDPYSDGHE